METCPNCFPELKNDEVEAVMDDLVSRLNEPEVHYPANFDTPKRANAILSALCQEAADEIERLKAERDVWQQVLDALPANAEITGG